MRSAAIFLLPLLLAAQTDFQQEGYVEFRGFAFPQTTIGDSGAFVGEVLIRYDVVYGLAPGWKLIGGTETRSDTHRQSERRFRLNWNDRRLQRPNFSIRTLSLQYDRGPLTLQAGRQYIRWGNAGVVSPLDRFAPRDLLTPGLDMDVLGVMAARAVLESDSDTFELIAQPLFTPSRIPLLTQRWTVLPENIRHIPTNDQRSILPGRTQWGARWRHEGDGYDASLMFFDGHNHQPLLELNSFDVPFHFRRRFPHLRMYGGAVTVPTRWLNIRGETGYFTSRNPNADEYVLYVLQIDRETPKWSFVAGYAGETVTNRQGGQQFAADRGFSRAWIGRARHKISASRSVRVDSAVRQSGDGLWLQWEYAEGLGPHWTGMVGFTLFRGEPTDFLGRYRRNSFFNVSLRYSF